jgi:hypothetical protein
MPKLETPTRVLWGTSDGMLGVEWAELTNREITEFFREIR